ncbi:MAG: Ig-like domain-containing protein [Bacteroidota bacterium]|nr:Ig-like domain-containing protein [Bacteroidota bacterium]
MHKFLLRRNPVLLILLSFLASCAQVLTPDGGPKDAIPPHVVEFAPDSAATNFTGNKIVLKFDEYIQLKDLNNQLIISPPLNNDPDVIIRRRDIVITLNDTLLPNTTYTISFGNSIRDITEENVLDNFRYVFSTGPVIDSLRISGKVVNASTLGGEKGILVMLYSNTGDSVPLKQRPYYFAKTKDDGSFTMTNLKAGKYKLIALDDKNSNYFFDNSAERIAFSSELLDLTKNNDSINLKIFKEEPLKQARIKAQQFAAGRFAFSYALPMKDPQVSFIPALPAGMEVFKEFSVNGDSIDLWFNTVLLDSITFVVHDETTALNDSVSMMMVKPGDKSKRIRTGANDPRKLVVNPNVASGQLFDLGKPLVITTNNPLRAFNPKDFILLKGKDTLKAEPSLSTNKRVISFNYTFAEDSSYSLHVKPGAVTDWFGQKNDTIKVNFKIRESRYYGTLSVKLTGLPAGNYLLRVVNDKDMVLREMKITNATTAKFELLSPGSYRLKLIADENKNGKWDSGNYLQHKQPERVIYYINPVKMRSGWDMDVEWIFKN